jgi:O-antigen/teichoic acid export membrane protein
VPLLFSQEAYSYYQLENLYCGYIWILTLGWQEGIYIYYGGKHDNEINKRELSTQFWMLLIYVIIVSGICMAVCGVVVADGAKRYAFGMALISVMLEAVRMVYTYYLVCIDNMGTYSKYVVADRLIYIGLVLVLIFVGLNDYRHLIGADIISKAVILVFILIVNRAIFFQRLDEFTSAVRHAVRLIKSGINIMVASFISRFITGTVRLAIDTAWGILVFGKISLTLSISNMFIQFIQALSVVMFPALRRTTEQNRQKIYIVISSLMDAMILTMFLLYLPGVKILSYVLPNYADGLKYMAILFPVCLFDARNTILDNTYLKVLHKERGMVVSNLIAATCSIVLTGISVFVLNSLNLAVITMVILVAIRCACSEKILSNVLGFEIMKDFAHKIVMSAIFIVANWYVKGIKGTVFYLMALMIYFLINRHRIGDSVEYLKQHRQSV